MRAAAMAIVLFAATQLRYTVAAPPDGRPMSKAKDAACGGYNGPCCSACLPGIAPTECDQWTCKDGLQCYMFADERNRAPDGGFGYPMRCFPTPKTCGQEGKPCCYSADPTDQEARCLSGLTCIADGVTTYSSFRMYVALAADPTQTANEKLMGTCRKLTKADCGKPYMPCGGAAKKLGCSNLNCNSREHFCASPGDTRLGGPRCLPLPPNCGRRDNACCPPNTGGAIRETSIVDRSTAVPWCGDSNSMCVWQEEDYREHGLATLPKFLETDALMQWDGVFERGYGRSRCAPLPEACGQPGQSCCPAMDTRLSGVTYNRQFKYQPCNYAAAGRVGMFCDGAYQGTLIRAKTQLGKCTINVPNCGKLGNKCCIEDVPEVGQVGVCMPNARPGQYYCTQGSMMCTKCPSTLKTTYEKQNCYSIPASG